MNLPTLQELYNQVLAKLQAEYSINIPLFGKNFLRAWAAVTAGVLWLLYKSIAKVQKNVFVDTADPEANGGTLERFGRVKLGRNPFPAVAGQYEIQFTGDTGAVVPGGTTFKSNDDSINPGKQFQLDADYVLDGITNTATVRSLEAGLDSKLDVGNLVSSNTPIPLVDREAIVVTEVLAPLAAEEIEDYRQKAIDAFRSEPQGGAGTDYRLWAADAQGVKQTYPYAASGVPNQVNLYIEATIADSSDGKGTPTAGIISDVQEAIEDPTPTQPSRKPLTVDVNYLPITVKEIDIEVVNFQNLTPTIEAAIATAIDSFLEDVRPFVGSIDVVANQNDFFDIFRISSLILEANPNSQFDGVVLKVDTIPVQSVQFTNGDIPNLNTITYV